MLYLQSFLQRTKISLEHYIEFVRKREQKVRSHYAETFEGISSNQFVEMILVDAAFVVELLCRNYRRREIDKNDRIFHKPLKLLEIRHDMMLLENQLPFCIFEDIFPLTKLNVPQSTDKSALIKVTYKFFKAKAYLGEEKKILEKMGNSEIKHFVDFFRQCHVPTQPPHERKIQSLTIPNVTKLYNAGVRFQKSTGSLLDIKFSQGTLEIPLPRIRTSTESFILNMLAFEQRHFLEYYINDYVFIINRLINSTEDAELLVQNGVFESKLTDTHEVVASISNLARGSILRHKHFNFKDLSDGLRDYCSKPWNTWMATLKRNYFSSPLTIFAVGVATAVFLLTLIQTLCSCGVSFK